MKNPAAKRGRPSKYVHMLRGMRKGDVLYIPEHHRRLDREIASTVWRGGGKVLTACFVATNLDPATAHRVIRITMRSPMRKA